MLHDSEHKQGNHRDSSPCIRARGEKGLKRLIETLSEAGHVFEAKDPDDQRFIKICPLGGGGENITQNDSGEQMIEQAASLLAENGGSLGYRDFFSKMNAYGYHNKDINSVVFSDLRFSQDSFMVHFEEEDPETEEIFEVKVYKKTLDGIFYYGKCPKCGTDFNYDEPDIGRIVGCRDCNAPMKLVKEKEEVD